MENKNSKGGSVDYVLVCNVVPAAGLWYYAGYFVKGTPTEGIDKPIHYPVSTDKYAEAMKISYKDECQVICDKINEGMGHKYYHVEEHMYA